MSARAFALAPGSIARGSIDAGSIEPGRARVTVLRAADAPARPSLLLPATPELVPLETCELPLEFTSDATHARARLEFAAGTSFYGTGEVVGPLERSGTSVTLWNTDAFEYKESGSPLYQSHPYVLAVRADGSALGLLADTIRRGRITIGEAAAPAVEVAVEFAFEREPFDVYAIEAAHPREVTSALSALLGRITMPPLWALGYHQCRWSYTSADELRALAVEFRRRGIPCDGLWLDIDYMDRFRVFTTNPETFPDLGALTDELRGQGFRTVAIVDPGVAVESELAAEGLERDVFVKDVEGKPATGTVWPGVCHFPDFTSAKARAWWSEHVREFVARTRLDGIWNDMNEPSVRDGPGHTLPDSCTHEGTDGSGGDHARWHNLYGQLMVEASRAGLARALPERRPFLLTRANHASGSRLSAMWTGDNASVWEHLRWSIPMVLNLGLCGQPFSGADVGGFSQDPDRELFARWFEVGALHPFFRGHAEKHARRKEPWAFDGGTETLVRIAIERRMRLLPTLYTLFREAVERGLPLARPLFFADPVDPALRAVDDAFLVGDDLLVAPVVHPRTRKRSVLFPKHAGGWYPFRAGAPITERQRVVPAPLGALPLFARAGSILFETEPRASTAVPAKLLVVHLFPDEHGRASGRLYEDEGEGHAHEQGVFRDARFTATASEREIVIEERATGSFDPTTCERFFVVHRGSRTTTAPRVRAESYRVQLS